MALAFNGSNLRRGSSGAYVKAAKERLFALGMYSPKVMAITNDTLGVDSVEAIRRFQIKNGLEVDGIIGPVTWAALFPDAVTAPSEDGAVIEEDDALSEMIAKIKTLCDEQVKNKSRYVWATGGELGASVTEKYIRTKEARCNGGANAERALRAWNAQIEAGNTVFRIFDCSGFVSWILTRAGVFSGRRNCDGLYSLCNRIDAPRDGALLFRVNSKDFEDETHVGIYIGGYQYHAKGRDDGVVCEKYKASYWHKIGWWKALDKL